MSSPNVRQSDNHVHNVHPSIDNINRQRPIITYAELVSLCLLCHLFMIPQKKDKYSLHGIPPPKLPSPQFVLIFPLYAFFPPVTSNANSAANSKMKTSKNVTILGVRISETRFCREDRSVFRDKSAMGLSGRGPLVASPRTSVATTKFMLY